MMGRRIRAALLGQAMASTLVAPVYSLVLLSRGATLATLSLCVAAQTATVVLLEVPSGVLSDLLGRKRLFLVSCTAAAAAYLTMLAGRGLAAMVLGCCLRGVSQAASSGTLDTLLVEDALERGGKGELERAVSALQLIEGIGAVASALVVGPLVAVDATYSLVLGLAAALEVALAAFAAACVREPRRPAPPEGGARAVANQVRGMGRLLGGSRDLPAVMIMFAVLGMTLGSVETYWQSSFSAIVDPGLLWCVSIVSCLGYGAANMGVWLARRLWGATSHGRPMADRWRALMACRLVGAALLVVIGSVVATGSSAAGPVVFAAAYSLAYLVAGAGNVMDASIVQAAVPNEQRASVSSLTSLCVRGGGLAISAAGPLALGSCGLAGAWGVFGALVAAGAVVALAVRGNLSGSMSRA